MTANSFHPSDNLSKASVLPDAGDGKAIVRRLWPTDSDTVLGHHLRLNSCDRYLRFGHMVSDDWLRHYCEGLDWRQGISLGAAIASRLVGIAHLIPLPHRDGGKGRAAEFAVSVERALRNRGIGTVLLGRMITLARNRAIRRVHMTCLLDNPGMRRIAGKHAAALRSVDHDIEGVIELPDLNPLSLMQEWLDEARTGWLITGTFFRDDAIAEKRFLTACP